MMLPVSVANRAKVPSARISMKTVPSTEYRGVPCESSTGDRHGCSSHLRDIITPISMSKLLLAASATEDCDPPASVLHYGERGLKVPAQAWASLAGIICAGRPHLRQGLARRELARSAYGLEGVG